MKLDTVLKSIGLTPKEAKTYLGLLEIGEANLKEIADKIEIPRTSIYTPVESLIKKGIIEFYKRKGRKYYVASHPEKLLELSRGNLELLEEHLDAFREISDQGCTKPKIRFFEGQEGIKLIFNEIVREKRNFLAITCIEDMEKVARENFGDFIQERAGKNLRLKLLANRSPESQLLKERDIEELRKTRFVPSGYRFDTANYIFGNKVALLSLKQEPVVAVLIEDKAIAETHRMYFDLIWKKASSD